MSDFHRVVDQAKSKIKGGGCPTCGRDDTLNMIFLPHAVTDVSGDWIVFKCSNCATQAPAGPKAQISQSIKKYAYRNKDD